MAGSHHSKKRISLHKTTPPPTLSTTCTTDGLLQQQQQRCAFIIRHTTKSIIGVFSCQIRYQLSEVMCLTESLNLNNRVNPDTLILDELMLTR